MDEKKLNETEIKSDAEEIKEKVEEKAHHVKEEVCEKADEMKVKAEILKEETEEKVEEAKNDIKDDIETEKEKHEEKKIEKEIDKEICKCSSGLKDSGSFWWGVLGFFFPTVGLTLFIVWRDLGKKRCAKAAGIGALIGCLAVVALYFMTFFAALMVAMAR